MAKAKKVVDEMFLAAAIALADHVDQDRIENGTVYPPLEELRDISAIVGLSQMLFCCSRVIYPSIQIYDASSIFLAGLANVRSFSAATTSLMVFAPYNTNCKQQLLKSFPLALYFDLLCLSIIISLQVSVSISLHPYVFGSIFRDLLRK